MLVEIPSGKVTSPIPTSSKKLVQLDIKSPMCFAVVEREEFFTLFSWLVALHHQCILDHVLDGGVEVFGPVFFHLVGLLFPILFILLVSLHTLLFLFVAWMSCWMMLLFASNP